MLHMAGSMAHGCREPLEPSVYAEGLSMSAKSRYKEKLNNIGLNVDPYKLSDKDYDSNPGEIPIFS